MPLQPAATGAIAGIVLLAGVVGFAVGLPEAVGDGGSGPDSGASEVPALPETVGDGFVASDTLEAEGEQVLALDRSAEAALEELYGGEVAVREYSREDPRGVLAVTVIAGEPGLFAPGGPPFDPSLSGLERSSRELRKIGDAVCSVVWQQPVPLGQQPVEGEQPAQVECQQGADGLTFDVISIGVQPEETAALLQDVVDTTTG